MRCIGRYVKHKHKKLNCLEAYYTFIHDFIYVLVSIGNTFIYTYKYIDIKVKWLAAFNSLEPGKCFQKFDFNMIYLVNLLFKMTWYSVTFC